jgi:hypothetical protein
MCTVMLDMRKITLCGTMRLGASRTSRTSPRAARWGRSGRQTAVVGGIQRRPTHAVCPSRKRHLCDTASWGRVLRDADRRDPTLVADGRIMCRSRFRYRDAPQVPAVVNWFGRGVD